MNLNASFTLGKLSLGMGDRFAHQAAAQLQACKLAQEQGIEITPVWNKSNREHTIVGSEPSGTRAAADAAVNELGWNRSYFLDADHIGLKTVDRFLGVCDFFTIDVANYIGKPPEAGVAKIFAYQHPELIGNIGIAGIAEPFATTREDIERIVGKYLLAVQEAEKVHRHILLARGPGNFVTEISMDETDAPQTPIELLVILAAIADHKIPIQTIAPKFTGRFNKGVDYDGNLTYFEREFEQDICVIKHAVKNYDLDKNLKLSIHSGSDKFSIYPSVRNVLASHNAGVHVKTAGTTWLEECIGLAESGGDGLALAKEIYVEAFAHKDELCAPYATVIDIRCDMLPSPDDVSAWTKEQYVSALRHDQGNPGFNPHLRQLLHVGFKVAAKMGRRYLSQLEACKECISRNVTTNLFERHIKPLFFP